MFRFFLKICLWGAGAAGFLFAGRAMAVTQSMTAHIAFDAPLSLTKTSDISFGAVAVGASDTYTISTSGAVTASGSGAWLHGTTAAGNITVAGSETQPVSISAGDYTADGGVALQNATCSYDGGAAGACMIASAPAPGSGKILLLGVQAVVDGTQAVGATAAPGFTVTVAYQ